MHLSMERRLLSGLLLLGLLSPGAIGEDCGFENVRYLADATNNGMNELHSSADSCRSACNNDAVCNYFTWYSPAYTDYPGYTDTCWFYKDEPLVQIAFGAYSSPIVCDSTATQEPATGCCDHIFLDSLGMSHYEQGDRVGHYSWYRTESSGKYSYRQDGGNNFLYYLPAQNVWMVGELLYGEEGGIRNRNSGDCPEDLTTDWEYWYGFFQEWWTDGIMECVCT